MRIIFLLLISFPTFAAYDRSDWKHWIDLDGDCQNTRQELLISESVEPVLLSTRQNGKKCTVVSGKWYGPYLNKFYTTASDLDLDHVIPLKWANDHGGESWSADKKKEFANDTKNLLLVDDAENQSKGAKGPGEWMPVNRDYHCEYIAKWQKLISTYGLLVGTRDKRQIVSVASACVTVKVVKKIKNSGLSFKPIKQSDGTVVYSNIPKRCFADGRLICSNLDPIFSSTRSKRSIIKPALKLDAAKAPIGMIKRSVNNKCHKPGGLSYSRTKKSLRFYSSMVECVAAGGVEALR